MAGRAVVAAAGTAAVLTALRCCFLPPLHTNHADRLVPAPSAGHRRHLPPPSPPRPMRAAALLALLLSAGSSAWAAQTGAQRCCDGCRGVDGAAWGRGGSRRKPSNSLPAFACSGGYDGGASHPVPGPGSYGGSPRNVPSGGSYGQPPRPAPGGGSYSDSPRPAPGAGSYGQPLPCAGGYGGGSNGGYYGRGSYGGCTSGGKGHSHGVPTPRPIGTTKGAHLWVLKACAACGLSEGLRSSCRALPPATHQTHPARPPAPMHAERSNSPPLDSCGQQSVDLVLAFDLFDGAAFEAGLPAFTAGLASIVGEPVECISGKRAAARRSEPLVAEQRLQLGQCMGRR